jgi:hypothetical protein
MRILRIIWHDVRWFSRLRPAIKIASLIIFILLVVAAVSRGKNYWLYEPVNVAVWYAPRMGSRLERSGVMLALLFCIYLVWPRDRGR